MLAFNSGGHVGLEITCCNLVLHADVWIFFRLGVCQRFLQLSKRTTENATALSIVLRCLDWRPRVPLRRSFLFRSTLRRAPRLCQGRLDPEVQYTVDCLGTGICASGSTCWNDGRTHGTLPLPRGARSTRE